MDDNYSKPKIDPPRWIPWRDLNPDAHPQLKRRGAYIVARLRPQKAAEEPTVSLPLGEDRGIVYVGETHGRTTNLRRRLQQFGHAAGFLNPRKNLHYAAYQYPTLAGVAVGEDGLTGYDDVFVALCPVPEQESWLRDRPDSVGVLPGLYESHLLWEFVGVHGHVPRLNHSGSHDGAAILRWAEEAASGIDSDDIAALLRGRDLPEVASDAARRITTHIAREWQYSTEVKLQDGGDDEHQWVCRHLGGGTWLYVGWARDSYQAFISLWDSSGCVFGGLKDEEPVEDEEGFRDLVRRAFKRWR